MNRALAGPRLRRVPGLLGAVALAALSAACGSDTVSSVRVTSVTLRPATATLIVGETQRFTVDIRDQDGNAVPTSIGVEWSASPASVITVDASGLVTAVGAGSGTVRAVVEGISGSARLTIEPPPTIAVTPATATLAGLLGGTPPPEPVELAVDNAGSGTLGGLVASVSYAAGQPTGWLTPSLDGTTAPTSLELSAVSTGLEVGEYDATVTLTSSAASNSPFQIPVRLRIVADEPVIAVTPSLVGFSGVSGGPRPPEQVVRVENVGGGELDDLSATIVYGDVPDWLTIGLSGASAPADLTLRADPGPLAPGAYRARARLLSNSALNAPKDVVVSFNVEARADVRVTKIGPDSAAAGTRVTYALQVRNDGPSVAESLVFTDTLPTNADLVAVPDGAVLTDGVLQWDLGDFAVGAQRSFAVEVDIPSGNIGVLRNAAGAASPSPDPSPSSRTAVVNTNVVRAADLEVVKTGPDSVFAGTDVSWTVVVHNRGPSDAVSVVVKDVLPDTTTFVSASDGGVVSGRVVAWPVVQALVAGDSLVRTVTASVPSSRTGLLVDTASAASAIRDPDHTNDTSVVVTPVVIYADLEAVAAAPSTVTAGTRDTLVAGVRNRGPSDASSVLVVDTLPAGMTFVSGTGGAVAAAGVVTWPALPVLAPGDSAIHSIVVDVSAAASGALRHVVTVGSATADPGPSADTTSASSAVVTLADLAVAKTGPASDTAGTAADYSVIVRNDGPSDALGVDVVDSLPAGATLVSASDAGASSAGVVTWPTVPVLAAGDSIVRTLRVLLDPASTGTATNVARASSTTTDPDTLDDRAAVATALLTRADLGLTKTGPASVVAGQTATYTLVARNAGPSAATGVVLTDTLSAGTSFVSATGGGSASGPVVTWPSTTVAPGDSVVVQVTVAVAPTRTTAVSNTAAVVSAVTDPVQSDNRASATTAVQVVADLAVAKSGPTTVTAGTNATWTVQVTNAGPSTATGIVVRDTLPAGVTFVTATGGGSHAAGVVTWPTLASLAPGGTTSFDVTVVVGPGTTGTIQNVAVVTASSPDPTPGDDRATLSVSVQASSDVSVTKTGAAVDTAGTSTSWTIQVSNAGPSTATGVVVTDTLPAGVSFASASGGGVASGGVVTWPVVATLAAGASRTYTVDATIDAATIGGIQNVAAAASASPDPVAGNGRATAALTVTGVADLSVSKTGAAVDTAGTSTTWTVQATNAGPSTATGVVVSDTLPPGLTGVTASNGGVVAGNVVTWNVGTLAAGASTPAFTVSGTLSPSTGGSVQNRARVAAATADPTTANDRSVVTTSVVSVADVSVTKTGAAVDTAGTSTSWTVQAANAGPSAAGAVVVTDTLPAGVTAVTASNGGVVVGNVVTWTVGTLAAGGTTPVFTVSATIPSTVTGAIRNAAAVTSTSADPTPADARTAVTTTVVAVADLSVAKTGAAVDTAGTATSWTVQATNAGPSQATGVVVSDTLPPGLTGVSASNGGVVSGNVVTWTVGTLASGASTPVYTINATIPSTVTGSIQNRARVAASTSDPSAGNDRSAVSTNVVAVADLSVTKTGAAVDTAGTTTSWTVQATNAGPSQATGVVVTDTLPAGVTGASASNGGVVVGNVVTWTVGTLASGASTPVYTVNATIPATATGSIRNAAGVTSTSADPAAANDRSAVTTTVVASADLSVTKTGAAVDTAGTSTSWTVQAANAGPSQATGVVVSDTLPPGLTGVTASNGGVVVGNVVTWTVGTLASGASTPVYTINATIPSTATGSIQNRARVASSSSDPAAANDRSAVTTTVVASADLSVTKTGAAVDTAGTTASWTVQAANAGPSQATGVVVSDTLPPGLTGVSASNGGVVSGNVVTWTVGTLASGASTPVYTINATIPSTVTGSIQNRARVAASTGDPAAGNDRSAVSTNVVSVADLSVAKTGAAVDTAGTSASWTVQATNAGPSQATGVVVTDTLPPGLSGVSASNGGVVSGNVVTWTVGTLASGASTPVYTINASIPSTATGSLRNAAAVAATSADPASGNDTQAVTTTVVSVADLSVTKTGAAVDTAGTTTSWTVQATNAGPSQATGVVVSDTLPPGLTGVSASNGGVVSGNVVTWTVGTLASGASTPVYTINATIPATTTGSLQNRARVAATSSDPAAANDRSAVTTTIVSVADLSVTKTGAAVDTAGTTTSWTVQATNAGPSQATGVVVSDTLPPGLTGVSASNGGVVSGNVVTWTVGTLASGASTPVYTITATIPSTVTGSIQNRARVASSSSDPAAANDRSAVTTTVVASADLSVTKTGAAVDTAGTTTSWTVQATNAGPSQATGVVVSDTLPPGLTGVSASNGGAVVGNVVTWTVGTLASGASTPVYTITATIPSMATGSIQNRARVAASTSDPAAANDRSAVSTNVVSVADLSVTKTGAAVDTAGTATSWTVQATNAGPSQATGVVVSDTLPPGLTGVSASNGGVVAGNVVTWTVGTLASGASTPVYTINATIPSSTTGSIQNRARVAAATADPTTANDRSAVTTTIVAAADLSVTKTGAAVDTAGTSASWTVQATNAGPSQATGVVVSDTLPPGLTGVSASNGGVVSGNVVTWTVGALASGASTPVYTIDATIPSTATGSIQNRARVAGTTADPTSANDRSAVTTTIVSVADLSVTKTGAAVDTAGTTTSWTVQAANAGPSQATGVVVSDTLPPGLTGVSASNGGVVSGNVVTWTVGTLASGASTPVYTINATIPSTATGSIQNRARVAATTSDPAAANDRSAVTTTLAAVADLSVTKTGAAVDTAGTSASWTVQANNAGPSQATGVVVTDTLPPGLTGVSASNGGVVSGNVVTWTVGTLASGASTPVYTVNATIPSTATGSLRNAAAVAATSADPTSGNDTQAVTTTVVSVADLSVTKTGAAVDTAGTTTSWTVQATNGGPSQATGVVVSDTLPPGLTGVSASNGGVVVGNVVTWTVGTLASGASTPVYTINATIPATATGSLQNRARVAGTTTDPTTGNDRSAVTTTIVASADLSVTKTGAAVDTAGTTTSWTVQATNGGPSQATGVVVSDTLPPGLTGVTASNGGSVVGNVVTWTVGTLASGASTPVYTIDATIPATATGSIQNRARVAGTTADPTTANDRSAVTTTLAAVADLSVTKTGAAVDTAGTTTSWTVQATNAGPSQATGVVVSDTLPPGLTGVSASNGGAVVGNVVTWTVGTLASGASTPVYTINATIPSTATGSLQNRARVAASTSDPAAGNDRSAVTTTLAAVADLSVTKTGAAVDTAGTSTSWTVQATNTGPSQATGVVVSDTLPPGLTGVTASNGGAVVGNVVTWTVGTLASGASTPVYTIDATIPSTATGSLQNRARVAASTSDPAAGNDRSAVTTTLAAVADLSVTKTGAAVDTAGTSTSWTVQATNTGPSQATGVVVSDTLPPGLTGVTASNGGAVVGNVVTWTVGTLASGASTPVYTIDATIPSTATGSIQNRARVAATTADPTTANDRSAVTTTLAAVADLVAGATAPASASAGSQMTMTVSVTNGGPSTATGVVVADTLPAGVTFVSATGGGVHSAGVVTWPTIASIGPGAPAITYDVVVDIGAGTSGPITNTVTVSGSTTDPTPGNDVATSVTTVSGPVPVPEPIPDGGPRPGPRVPAPR